MLFENLCELFLKYIKTIKYYNQMEKFYFVSLKSSVVFETENTFPYPKDKHDFTYRVDVTIMKYFSSSLPKFKNQAVSFISFIV